MLLRRAYDHTSGPEIESELVGKMRKQYVGYEMDDLVEETAFRDYKQRRLPLELQTDSKFHSKCVNNGASSSRLEPHRLYANDRESVPPHASVAVTADR